MKLRSFIIVLLAVFMVFAFASCNNEPKVEPESSYKIVRLTAEKGRADGWNEYDKFELLFATPVEKGDVVSVTYRTTRPIDQYNVRVVTTTNGDHRWVYEQDKSALTSYDDSDPDGWITVTYEFSDYADRVSGSKENHVMTDELYEGVSDFAFHFRGKIVAGDFMEIKEVLWNDEPVDISTVAKAALGKSGDVVQNEKNVEEIDSKDSTWKKDLVTYYVMFYADPTQHKKDKPVGVNYENDDYLTGIGVAVKSGEKVAKPADPEREGYTFGGWCKDKIYDGTDTTRIWDFDNDTVTENRMLYAIWTLNNNTITFNLNGGSAKEGEADAFAAQTVATAGTVTKPEAEPVVTGDKLFAVWCTDAEGKEPYDFATPVTGNLTLYARYDDPVYVTFDKNDGSADDLRLSRVPLLSGKTVAKPADDPVNGENYFAGWFLGEATESYDFSTPVTENITLKAKWMEPVVVTLDPNYKIDEVAVEATTTKTGYGAKMTQPADPAEREGYVFDKWTTDAEGTTEYVFGDDGEPVTKAFTLYAQWIKTRTVTLYRNFPEDTEDVVFKAYVVADGVAVDDPEECVAYKGGYVVGKWTTDKAGTNDAYDFATAVTADIPLYAQWEKGKIAQLVSTFNRADSKDNYDKFRVKFTSGDYKQAVEGGDVLTFRFRSTTPITHFNVRGDKKWIYQQKLNETYVTKLVVGDDGWTYVTYTFPKADGTNAFDDNQGTIPENFYESERTFYFDFISYTIVKGDIIEVQGMALNGKELKIDGGNTQSGDSNVKPDYNSVKSEYAWSKQTVTFNTGVADAIDPLLVDFGGRATAPETDPSKDGYVFVGWFADAEFKKEFDFANTPITDATTIYAWLGVKKVLSFDSQEGSAVDPIDAAEGAPIDEPEEPTRLGFLFDGWYKEAACTNAFDFSAGINADTTVFAKWIAAKAITLNTNGGTVPASVLYVENGKTLSEPVQVGKPGFFFGGWYDDAELKNAHDFSEAVTADGTLHAKWIPASKIYKLTATCSDAKKDDRFQLRFKSDKVSFLTGFKPGDVVTYQIKFTPVDETSTITKFRVRGASSYGDTSDFSEGITTEDVGEGWISVKCVFPNDATYSETGILMDFRKASGDFAKDDILEIRGLAFNGKEIEFSTTSTSQGPYEGVYPTLEIN